MVQQHSQQVPETITSITSALHEQSLAVGAIAREVEQVARMSEESSRIAVGTTLISQTLQAPASVLHEAVSRFKV